MRVDEADRAWFFCCAEGAIPLSEIHARLRERAESFARAAGMREPAVYARWLLAQYGMTETDDTRQDVQVMSYAYSSQAAESTCR